MPGNIIKTLGAAQTLDFAAVSSGVTAGVMQEYGTLNNEVCGFPLVTAASGVSHSVVVGGVEVEYDSPTGDTPAIGALVYYDDVEDEVTTTAGGHFYCGRASKLKGSETRVRFILNSPQVTNT